MGPVNMGAPGEPACTKADVDSGRLVGRLVRMPPESPADQMRRIVAVMRELGVTRYRAQGVEVELGPVPLSPAPEPKPEPEEKCQCGCPVDQHGPVGCLNGCPMDLCVGSGQKPPPEETVS